MDFEDPKIDDFSGSGKVWIEISSRVLWKRVRKSDVEKIIRVGVRFGRVGSSQYNKT